MVEHAATADSGELHRVTRPARPATLGGRPVRRAGRGGRCRPCRPRRRSPSPPPGGRSGDRVAASRECSMRSLSIVSAATPVSDASTSAAAAEGATPNTARPSARSCSTAGVRAVVLPVPAGPTTKHQIGVAGDRCGGLGLRAGQRRPGPGSTASAESMPSRVMRRSAQARSRSSWARIAGVVSARSATDSVTGRPSRRNGRAVGDRAGDVDAVTADRDP